MAIAFNNKVTLFINLNRPLICGRFYGRCLYKNNEIKMPPEFCLSIFSLKRSFRIQLQNNENVSIKLAFFIQKSPFKSKKLFYEVKL